MAGLSTAAAGAAGGSFLALLFFETFANSVLLWRPIS